MPENTAVFSSENLAGLDLNGWRLEDEKVSSSEEESKPCYLFYRPKNSTLSPHLHAGLVGPGKN